LEEVNRRLKEVQEILMRTEKLSIMGEMAATVAHEMRSPLISIGGFARLVKENLSKDDVNNERLNIIIEEVNRLERIIKDVLDFVKPFKLTLSEANIEDVIKDVLNFFRMGIKRENVILTTDFNGNLPLIKVDVERLKQVLINILENAFDAIPSEGNINVKTYVTDNFVNIDISDDGIGIKDEYINEVTKPFFTTKPGGIGLGLSIAEKIIKEHKGNLQISKNEKRGVIFKISLPR